MINVFQPSLGNEELTAVKEVFESNWIGKGKRTAEFEKQFAEHANVSPKLLRSTTCCSEGLFNSMSVFRIGPGDEVILPTISFVGAANAIAACGAKPVFCDVDKRSLNVTANDIEKVLTSRTKAILLLHYGGVPCEMDEILKLAEDKNIKVIEDSACSVASRYKGKLCGTLGDMGMFSFDAMKILVCGDGSILYFRNEEDAVWAEKHMYFGLDSKSGFSNAVDTKWWEFSISQFGHRAIMNDMTAAIAIEQLKKLSTMIGRRKEIHQSYSDNLSDMEWIDLPPQIPENCESSYYLYHIQIKNGKRDELASFLRGEGIYTTFRYYPLHWVEYYGCTESFPNAEYAANNTLCIPIHQSLSEHDVNYIVDSIRRFGQQENC